MNNGSTNVVTRAGIWFGENNVRNKALRLPEGLQQSNNSREAVAILRAARITPPDEPLIIKSNSKLILNSLTKNLRRNKDNRWIGLANQEIIKFLVARLKSRRGPTLLVKVKSHTKIEGNEGADKLADMRAKKLTPDKVDPRAPEGYMLKGAKLASITQTKIYEGMLERKLTSQRRGTAIYLNMMRWAVLGLNEELPIDERIWRSI